MLGQSIYYHVYLIIKYKTPTEYGVYGYFVIIYMSLCKSPEHIQPVPRNPFKLCKIKRKG